MHAIGFVGLFNLLNLRSCVDVAYTRPGTRAKVQLIGGNNQLRN